MAAPLSEVVVRVAHPRDAADVGAIAALRALWITNRPDDTDFESRLAAWLAAEGDQRTTWLAFAREQPAGMVSLLEYRRMPLPGRPASCWGYVSNLFVRAPLRARGIGSALLGALIATADEREYVRLVVSPQPRARPLFERAGFVVADDASPAVLLARTCTM